MIEAIALLVIGTLLSMLALAAGLSGRLGASRSGGRVQTLDLLPPLGPS
jgi:hypothetical protein